jgi:hypothetical protein
MSAQVKQSASVALSIVMTALARCVALIFFVSDPSGSVVVELGCPSG